MPPSAVPRPAHGPATWLRHRVLAISAREVSFEVRGFHQANPAVQAALERHGASFVAGFNAALLCAGADELEVRLEDVELTDRGFSYEGAAMALAVLDLLTPGARSRLGDLLRGPGLRHVYMLHVGAGWALARLHMHPRARLPVLDPFLRWLSVDGYGFHQGFFHPRRYVYEQCLPRRLRGYERRAFDQGLGRCLWFVTGGDVARAAATIASFAAQRQGDLWSGLGLAASYTTAGGAAQLEELRELSRGYRHHVAQGAAFAAGARQLAQNVVDHTRLAAEILCGRSLEEVTDLVEAARAGLGSDHGGRNYEGWRTRLREGLAGAAEPAR